jgi:hypothetical protein
MAFLPIIAAVVYLLLLARILYRKRMQERNPRGRRSSDLLTKAIEEANELKAGTPARRAWNLLRPMILALGVTVYTFLVSNAVSPFNCVSHMNDGKLVYIMATNPVQRCYDAQWKSHLPFVIALSLIYGIFLPIGVLAVFIIHRKKLDEPQFIFNYGSLTYMYRRELYFWELISMLKRASFVVMSQFLASREDQYATKFTASIISNGFFSGLEILFIPYATKSLNILSST